MGYFLYHFHIAFVFSLFVFGEVCFVFFFFFLSFCLFLILLLALFFIFVSYFFYFCSLLFFVLFSKYSYLFFLIAFFFEYLIICFIFVFIVYCLFYFYFQIGFMEKFLFFQVLPWSVLLYDCITWILTKRFGKKLSRDETKMLLAVLNISCKQHLTKHQLYGNLPPNLQIIQVRRVRRWTLLEK